MELRDYLVVSEGRDYSRHSGSDLYTVVDRTEKDLASLDRFNVLRVKTDNGVYFSIDTADFMNGAKQKSVFGGMYKYDFVGSIKKGEAIEVGGAEFEIREILYDREKIKNKLTIKLNNPDIGSFYLADFSSELGAERMSQLILNKSALNEHDIKIFTKLGTFNSFSEYLERKIGSDPEQKKTLRGLLEGKKTSGKSLETLLKGESNVMQLRGVVEKLLAERGELLASLREVADDFYGHGYEVSGYHLNGELESMDKLLEGGTIMGVLDKYRNVSAEMEEKPEEGPVRNTNKNRP